MKPLKIIDYFIAPKKQGAKRHYGVHPYFTRRPWNVVQEYIKCYAPKQNGIVLDPFGGSGVTAIEAAVLGHKGIQIDINPLATFIAKEISRVSVTPEQILENGVFVLDRSKELFRRHGVRKSLSKYWNPSEIKMPANADVDTLGELFSKNQLAKLSILHFCIKKIQNPNIRNQMLLVFSATLGKTNKTFVSAKNRAPSRGGATILSLYRYHVPKKPVILCPFEQFESRLKNILKSKHEVIDLLKQSGGSTTIYSGSATKMNKIHKNSVDYIFTDPPYGDYINYLDLSTMWNAWLEKDISAKQRKNDVLPQKGDHEIYFELLNKSFQECFRVLKPGAFISIVFCHRDLMVWDNLFSILNATGFEYVKSVPQPLSTVWSMHKKKNDLSAIAGELIITFRKPGGKKITIPKTKEYKNVEAAIASLFKNKESINSDELVLNLIPKMYESRLLGREKGKSKKFWTEVTSHLSYCESTKLWNIDQAG